MSAKCGMFCGCFLWCEARKTSLLSGKGNTRYGKVMCKFTKFLFYIWCHLCKIREIFVRKASFCPNVYGRPPVSDCACSIPDMPHRFLPFAAVIPGKMQKISGRRLFMACDRTGILSVSKVNPCILFALVFPCCCVVSARHACFHSVPKAGEGGWNAVTGGGRIISSCC